MAEHTPKRPLSGKVTLVAGADDIFGGDRYAQWDRKLW